MVQVKRPPTSDANGLVAFTGFEAKDYVVKELTAQRLSAISRCD